MASPINHFTPINLKPIDNNLKDPAIRATEGEVTDSWVDSGWSNVAVDGPADPSSSPSHQHRGILLSQRSDGNYTAIRSGDGVTPNLEAHLTRGEDGQANLVVRQGHEPGHQVAVTIPLGNASQSDGAYFNDKFGREGALDLASSTEIDVKRPFGDGPVMISMESKGQELDYQLSDGQLTNRPVRHATLDL